MRRPQGIIPDIVLEKIEENAQTIQQRNAARRSLMLSRELQSRRSQAVEPEAGEVREVYDANNTESMGQKARGEDDPESGDAAVDALYDDTGRWYDLLFRQNQRRSYDGNGAKMIVVAHYGDRFDNAYWDGVGIFVGDGYFFEPFYRSQVVTFHEWTHALTEKTVGLQYNRQPGALNEFISDAWAVSLEQKLLGKTAEEADWLVGRELFRTRQGRALRDMAGLDPAYDDPLIGRDPQVKHMRDYYNGFEDNGGVHINSGIPNRAYALAALHHGGFTYQWLLPILADVMLRQKVGPMASFQQFANAMRTAAVDRYGVGAPEVGAVEFGWREVGITVSDAPAPAPEPLPPSPCAMTDAEILGLLRSPTIEALPPLQGIVGMSDAELLALARNPAVTEAALALAAMPQARRLMAVARLHAKKENDQ